MLSKELSQGGLTDKQWFILSSMRRNGEALLDACDTPARGHGTHGNAKRRGNRIAFMIFDLILCAPGQKVADTCKGPLFMSSQMCVIF